MTIAVYFIVGAVVWMICTVETCIRKGYEYVKTQRSPGWKWFTDIIMTMLAWPYVILCYALGASFRLLTIAKD